MLILKIYATKVIFLYGELTESGKTFGNVTSILIHRKGVLIFPTCWVGAWACNFKDEEIIMCSSEVFGKQKYC